MKKILSITLAVLMVMAMIPTAFATTNYTNGTQVEYTASGSEAYTITVPALLAPGASGTVTLAGTWSSDRKVTVTAADDVTLTNSINANDKHTLDVTFAGISKVGDNTQSRTYTETVAVAEMPDNALFGTWSGTFYYNVEVGAAVEMISFTISNISHTPFQAEKGMTWGEWVNSEYNTIGAVLHSNGNNIIGKYAVIENVGVGIVTINDLIIDEHDYMDAGITPESPED